MPLAYNQYEMSHAVPLPPQLASRAVRVLRPRDATEVYRHPAAEFARLERAGLLRRVARGYYALPPDGAPAEAAWRPTAESVALGIGIADYGRDAVALSGISAARLLGVPPRAVAAGVVSIPIRRPPIETIAGPVSFWHRSITDIATQKARTDLGVGWATTAEQTLLDLADRPRLAGLAPRTTAEAMWDLAARVDWFAVQRLSEAQDRPSAYARALWACAGLVSDMPRPRLRRPVPTKGLASWSDADPRAFGMRP
jgi:predicted transcriptional regulator of viral defense system